MPHYKWHPSFTADYNKFWYPPDRYHGEHAYDDQFRPERPPSMLQQPEPDYTIPIKPYHPVERSEPVQARPWETIEAQPTPAEMELASMESELFQPKKKDNFEPLEGGGWS